MFISVKMFLTAGGSLLYLEKVPETVLKCGFGFLLFCFLKDNLCLVNKSNEITKSCSGSLVPSADFKQTNAVV